MQALMPWSASVSAAVTWYVHTFIGGVHVARPLLTNTSLPKAAKWLAYYCWHLATLMLAAVSMLFGASALGYFGTALVASLSMFCFCCSALSIGVAVKGQIAPWRFPSTSLFALTGVFGLAAAAADDISKLSVASPLLRSAAGPPKIHALRPPHPRINMICFAARPPGAAANAFREQVLGFLSQMVERACDGGSVPQIFWGIPGLSRWALGPAYIIHDWIFLVHRCDLPAPPEVKAITFDQSAQILAEVGKSLVDAGLIKDNKLEEIVWAVRTKYAQSLWDRPPTPRECETPVVTAAARKRLGLRQSQTIVDFVIPPPRR